MPKTIKRLLDIELTEPCAGWASIIFTWKYDTKRSKIYTEQYGFSYVKSTPIDLLNMIENIYKDEFQENIHGITMDQEDAGELLLVINDWYVLLYNINDSERHHLFLYGDNFSRLTLCKRLLEYLEKYSDKWVKNFLLDDINQEEFNQKIKSIKNILGGSI